MSVQSAVSSTYAPLPHDEKGKRFGNLVDAYVKGRKGYSNQIFDFLAQRVSPKVRVLDLGCGTGISTSQLGETFEEVHGCDHDSVMLQAARKIAHKSAQFTQGSAYNLPYKNDSFGLVTMFNSFHWYCNPKATREIHRIIGRNGYVCAVSGAGTPYRKEVFRIIKASLGHKIVFPMESRKKEEMLSQNGFNIVGKQKFQATKEYTVEEALHRIQSFSGWNDVIAAKKEAEVLENLKHFYQQRANPDGIIQAAVKETVILGQKQD